MEFNETSSVRLSNHENIIKLNNNLEGVTFLENFNDKIYDNSV